MWREVRLLTTISLRNVLGINQIRFSGDKKQKNRLRLLLVTYAILGVILGGYTGALSYGLVLIGMDRVLPAYLLTVISMLIFFFTAFKAGSILFDTVSYEMLTALPVRQSSIVLSRFLNMYVQNIGMCLVVMLPAAGVYAWFRKPGLWFFFSMMTGTLLIPLLPMTAACVIGALVTAVSSRIKHRNLINTVLTLGLTIGFIVIVTVKSASLEMEGSIPQNEAMIKEMADMLEMAINSIYPPAKWFGKAVMDGSLSAFVGYLLISVVPTAAFIFLVQRNFQKISRALRAQKSLGNYRLQGLKGSSQLKALYFREIKRYFASGLYVMNTLIGYLLIVVLAAGILTAGVEKMEEMLEIPGLVGRFLPFVLAMICGMGSTTVSSISMEGKQWWLVKSLPVTTAQILDSKILVNLTVGLPCLLVSDLILLVAVKTTVLGYVWIFVIPLAYLLLFSVLGITINLKMPLFDWETEAAAVKQSGAMLVSMLISMASGIVPMILIFILPESLTNLCLGAVTVLVLAVTAALYRRNRRVDLRKI